ncbi:MAG: AAA family ATPase [Methylococcaceae bacterium]|nr:AAA family ATPase [Methylococcaceae bacterium]
MLKRLYIHNYKCLVNFEINFDKDISLFLGANGSGKSTVFEVLTILRKIIINEEKLEYLFERNNKPRGFENQHIENIHFELEFEVNDSIYKYILLVETFFFSIKEESLYLNNDLLITSKEKETTRYRNENIFSLPFGNNEKTLFEPSRSSMKRYASHIKDFFQYFNSLFIARINSYEMFSTINKTNTEIKTDFSNYAEWFSYLNESYRKELLVLENNLPEILVGFEVFRIQQAGRSKILQLGFKNSSNEKDIFYYDFDELSEGQKTLIALYTLIYCTPDNSIICIDEPENFLALPEIQPWFDELYDQCAERNLQVILISHHPKIINFLANDSGYWFSREHNLTKIQKIVPENESGLSIAELVDRGWIYEQ